MNSTTVPSEPVARLPTSAVNATTSRSSICGLWTMIILCSALYPFSGLVAAAPHLQLFSFRFIPCGAPRAFPSVTLHSSFCILHSQQRNSGSCEVASIYERLDRKQYPPKIKKGALRRPSFHHRGKASHHFTQLSALRPPPSSSLGELPLSQLAIHLSKVRHLQDRKGQSCKPITEPTHQHKTPEEVNDPDERRLHKTVF